MKKFLYLRPSIGSIPLNTRFGELLSEFFPEYSMDVVEVYDLMKSNRKVIFVNLLHTFRLYWWEILTRRRALRTCYRRTPYLFRQTRRKIAELHTATDYAFSVQIQSVFDASYDNVPNFVYTDHTHLANLTYSGVTEKDLFHRSWIDCEAEIYRNAAKTFTMSSNIADSIVRDYGVDSDRVLCIYSGTNSSVADAAERVVPDPPNILFVGVDWERKGGPVLLEAFNSVAQRVPRVKLTIVGCTPEIPPASNIDVVGKVPLASVHRYFNEATVFCMPTRREPFGIVFIEALAHRLPIVSTRVGALPDIVVEGESGFLIEPDDPVELAERLVTLLIDTELQHRFGVRGRRLYDERYTWEAVFAKLRETVLPTLVPDKMPDSLET